MGEQGRGDMSYGGIPVINNYHNGVKSVHKTFYLKKIFFLFHQPKIFSTEFRYVECA